VFGTVGRMQEVKDQPTLARAFVRLLALHPELKATARLALVGDGPLRARCAEILAAAGIADLAWLPGERSDVADVLRACDVFVLPSLGEGISNTILEAMATGLPVVATAVGGNPELVTDGETGALTPAADPEAMARAMAPYALDESRRRTHGAAGRATAERRFSLEAMVAAYVDVYDHALAEKGIAPRGR
jgi:glycosyltransferase involved in cell wall biosynthesis